jgi:predicted lipoprotein
MRNANRIVLAATAGLALAACHKQDQTAQNNTITMDAGITDNQVAAGNADIETLPADESSTTPSSQLQNGSDNPDVNGLGPANSE